MHTIALDSRIAPPRLSSGVLAAVILIHVGLLAVILAQPRTTQSVTPPAPLFVRLIAPVATQPQRVLPPVPPKLQPPTPRVSTPPIPTPPRPAPELVKPARPPQPVELAQPENPRPEPQPAPVPTPAPAPVEVPRPAPPPPLPVTQPRFNADYLDNPKPPYPSVSRRMGEEGEVRLRVHVDAAGHAQQVEISRSSDFPRLDQAALETVRQWRFIPARQGDQPIPAWVIVPIQFSLRS